MVVTRYTTSSAKNADTFCALLSARLTGPACTIGMETDFSAPGGPTSSAMSLRLSKKVKRKEMSCTASPSLSTWIS